MKFDQSKQWFERACKVIPGGINSNVRAISEPFPLFYARAKDAHLWDIDGNEYIDYVLGQGPMLLGHTPAVVLEAIRKQLDLGLVYAGQTEAEVRAAELMVKHIPCAEMVRFNNSGSEAVHAALRLARSATNRKKIIRFEGHYHGWFDNIAWNPMRPGVELGPRETPVLRPSSKGQPIEDAANLIVCPWNDAEVVEQCFATRGDEIAGVICDPFANACGIIPAEKSFLENLQQLCTRHGAVLIFDEVITGFRLGPGGAQAYYGVTPDLATYAKALGAGLCVSALAGKASLMSLFGELSTVHSGTYNSNPVAMAGTLAALELLLAEDGAELAKANRAGKHLWDGLAELSHELGVPITFRGVPAEFSTTFLPEDAQPLTDMRSALQADAALLKRFWSSLHHEGVQMTAFGIWFLSTTHTEKDIEKTLIAARRVLSRIMEPDPIPR